MVLIDELVQVSDTYRRLPKIIELGAILLVLLLVGTKALLVGGERHLHEEVVFDELDLEDVEAALREQGDGGEPSNNLRTLLPALLPFDLGRRCCQLNLFILLVAIVLLIAGVPLVPHASGGSLAHGT